MRHRRSGFKHTWECLAFHHWSRVTTGTQRFFPHKLPAGTGEYRVVTLDSVVLRGRILALAWQRQVGQGLQIQGASLGNPSCTPLSGFVPCCSGPLLITLGMHLGFITCTEKGTSAGVLHNPPRRKETKTLLVGLELVRNLRFKAEAKGVCCNLLAAATSTACVTRVLNMKRLAFA